MAKKGTKALLKFLASNLPLHIVIENEVRLTPFGQLTFNVVIKDGLAQVSTLNVVKSRRRRYGVDKAS